MAQSASTPGTPHSRTADSRDVNPWAAGGIMFAGVLLMVDGVLGAIKGIAGIASNDVYARINDYAFKFDVTAWGWIHLALGIVLVVVGWGILRGIGWARWVGVALAALNMIANFMWLPYQPVWAVVSLAIDTFVIWALCTDRSKAVI
ncbi:hypothetical protein OG322_26740 [Streptomyces sp. NBC_01260]|uniref:DUF7144 family membrane protein n=1 Tax=unclassified Streptomyces TaxID=2593676 RepID=UPI000F472A4B|nr:MULTISPECIES: hypothetical protein [unclassified Streptomyces]MCX4772832.1 hypothetical protein [Streptomyces sp. NBC_01285]ROQ71200.1 hypothetical protein EDD95_7292 [Streptomyces sp. CEV 2-1]RPK51765.1 hypothetical protein EES39_03185 [Streptomyces sp. ADI92-24]